MPTEYFLEAEERESVENGTRHRVLIGDGTTVRAVSLEEALSKVRRSADGMPEKHEVVWIDIVRPTEADATFLREGMKFHPLTVEDCMHGLQTPKLERYPGYFFLVVYAARINPERNRPAFYELHTFVGANYLVTVRQESVREVRELMARWRAQPRHLSSAGHVAHGVLDAIMDSYFPMVDHFSARVAATESEVYEQPKDVMQHIMSLRRELLRFRGVVGPTRDLLNSLLRRDLPFLNPELLPYFQDVRDHSVRITEEIDMLRDLLSTAVDAQFTVTSNQLNQTVRMMTAWSIILMSMSVIAGIYGMNFTHMPELHWRYGYSMAIGAMFAVGLLLVALFRKKHWL